MKTCALIRTIGARLYRFARAEHGNTTIIFAIACIPLFGLVGAAVDYSRAATIRSAMQTAADATALALSRWIGTSGTTPTQDSIQTQAQTYFEALFTRKDANLQTVTATYTTTNGNQVLITANATMNTDFMRVMTKFGCGPVCTTIPLQASSTTTWGNSRLRVALVLDNTGSMSQGSPTSKMSALKQALIGPNLDGNAGLLNQLKTAATNAGDVYVSIIPFVKDVAVDSNLNYGADWIYWGTSAQDSTLSDNTSWDAKNGTCSIGSYSPRSQCLQHYSCSISGYYNQSSCTSAGVCSNPGQTTQSSCTTQQACSLGSYYTKKSTCQNNGGIWGYGTWKQGVWTQATWTPKDHSTWNGCLTDRGTSSKPGTTAGNDETVTAPTSSDVTTLFPAEQYSQCSNGSSSLQTVMPLSYDWTSMTNVVKDMVAGGSTNQNIGLVHGWQSLVGGGPYPAPPAETTGYTYQKVIILLTDGLNTQDRWYGDGSSLGTTDDQTIDARQKTTCDAINAAGITLYAVQVDTDSEPTSTLLQSCAGSPGKYPDSTKFFLLTSPDQIITTFQQIGTTLSQLRVAK